MAAQASGGSDRDVRLLPADLRLGGLMAKALATSMGRPPATAGLPDRTAMVMEQPIGLERLAVYNRLTGFGLADEVPATWLHVLTFPLQAYLMAQRDFPFPLPGMVHLANEMTQYRPVLSFEALRLSVHARNPVPHRRGVAFEFVGEAHVGDELVWSGVTTYLASKQTLPGEPVRFERPEPPDVEPSQKWRLPADLGRRYAGASGDVNPIHLSPVTARLFGFSRPIIHGMWTHARALAALGPRVPKSYTVAVSFTKPILLPGGVRFAAQQVGPGWRFAVLNRAADAAHLLGVLNPH